MQKLFDSESPSNLNSELHEYRSVALRAKVASFHNTGLCFVKVLDEDRTSSCVSAQHAATAVMCKSE